MPLIRRVSNEMGNALMYMDVSRTKLRRRVPDDEMLEKLRERGWVHYQIIQADWFLTWEGGQALDRWYEGRKKNIAWWSRKWPLFYEQNDCSHRAGYVTEDGNVVDLEPIIVREMIDNGLLQYESEADSWVAPFAADPVAVQEECGSVKA
jgi:hypothetical protein